MHMALFLHVSGFVVFFPRGDFKPETGNTYHMPHTYNTYYIPIQAKDDNVDEFVSI